MPSNQNPPIGGDGREDLEATDRPLGKRRDAVEERDRAFEHGKTVPEPQDAETLEDEATGVPKP